MLHKQHSIAVALLALRIASAQSFEVASVRPLDSATGLFTLKGGPGTSDPTRITYSNVPLRRVLLEAYPVKNYQLVGPDWLNSLRYDISAKVQEGTTKEQFQAMLQNLLVNRFQMTVRREEKVMPLYDLVVAKNGPKIRSTTPDATTSPDEIATVKSAEGKDGFPVLAMRAPGVVIETKDGRARITAKDVPMEKFADFLATRLGRPVMDHTALAGVFTFDLYFTPEGPNASDSTEPPLETAIQQQLGLRLEARKRPVEMLVIDHAEKVPSAIE